MRSAGRVSVDRRDALREAYQEAFRVGEDLLQALQGSPTDEVLDQIDRLLEAREAVTQRTVELFQPGDRAEFEVELKALLQQQRAIEAQISSWQSDLRGATTELQRVRSAMKGVGRALKTAPRSRLLDERR